ncbi:MAG: hypothetical protein EXX96DRAFT_473786 [Benjaminiella poitrasii]|nr:MAG: hypothetical protein EXX96DRAFT_473786 [Benjaminiella poitrasii]
MPVKKLKKSPGSAIELVDQQKQPWHTKSIDQVATDLETSIISGLSHEEALRRQSLYGLNELGADGSATWLRILLRQCADIMNWIFIALGIASYALSDYITGSLLVTLAITNFYLTFQQEYAAEQTLAALKDLSSPRADVIRGGVEISIDSKELVPGDLLLIKEGDSAAADARVINASNLDVDEALLTGESLPVQKQFIVLENEDEPLGDRVNMIYSSTIIAKGRGQAIVTATGMQTEIGKVATKLADNDNSRTRIQKSLHKMYVALLITATVSVIIVLASVKFRNINRDVAMYAMTVALSVLPAGLTTVMTVTLVLGGKEMSRHRAVVRKLKVLETLGSITHIFSDKTGTLTMAKMVVVHFWVPNEGYFYVTPNGLAPKGDIYCTFDDLSNTTDEKKKTKLDIESVSPTLDRLVECAALCNMSSIRQRGASVVHAENASTSEDDTGSITANGDWIPSGAPTEVALQVFAHKFGRGKPYLMSEAGWELIQEYQFDSVLKRMSTIWYHQPSDKTYIFTKGAAERVLPLCTLDAEQQEEVMQHVDVLAAKGLRVITMAYQELPTKVSGDEDREQIEQGLHFLGLTGIYDPPRAESRQAIREAHEAGISVHMLTGDHAMTATAIAKELNILNDEFLTEDNMRYLIMTGPQFDSLTEDEIDALPHLPLVVARCSPDTKVNMILASQRRNNISAMTGDGVNDSPSLRMADVGISMGKNGSDVAKQASDIILTDDNFATIIRAISEGRRIYRNMQRFLLYFWITLLALWLVLLLCLAFRDEESQQSVAPLSTIALLFLYVAFTPPAGELSIQPATKQVMLEPPRPPKESLFNREILMDLAVYAIGLGLACLVSFVIPVFGTGQGLRGASACESHFVYDVCEPFFKGRGLFLAVITMTSLITMVHCRSYRDSEWNKQGLRKTFKSKPVFGTFIFDVVCLVLFFYIPDVSVKGFYMLPITWEWAIVVGLSVFLIAYGEVYKALKRKYLKPLESHKLSEYIRI